MAPRYPPRRGGVPVPTPRAVGSAGVAAPGAPDHGSARGSAQAVRLVGKGGTVSTVMSGGGLL